MKFISAPSQKKTIVINVLYSKHLSGHRGFHQPLSKKQSTKKNITPFKFRIRRTCGIVSAEYHPIMERD